MIAVQLLVKNLIIISLVDQKVTKEEITAIYDICTKTHWFLQDAITIKELKIIMKEYILLYQQFDADKLIAQFHLNTSLLKDLIPTNQKFEHIKLLQSLANSTALTQTEQRLIEYFENQFLEYISDEAVLASLAFEDYKNYITVLIQYSSVDQISINERYVVISEIDLYLILNNMDCKSIELYQELLREVQLNENSHPGSRFIQNSKNLLLLFDSRQDKYFLKTIEQIKRADNKISTQEKSFDTLLIVAKKRANREETKVDEALNVIAFNVNSPYKITIVEQIAFGKLFANMDISNNLFKAFVNMKNILRIHFELETLDEESLYRLFKNDKLSYQQLLFMKKLFFIAKLKNQHVISRAEYVTIIDKIASVSFHYYREIPVGKRETYAKKFPIFELKV